MFSSGLPTLDALLLGGYTAGIVELYGETGAGVTSLCAAAIKCAARTGRPCLFVHVTPIDKQRLLQLGVPPNIPVLQCTDWETTQTVIVRAMQRMHGVLTVIDGFSAIETQAELATDLMEEAPRSESGNKYRLIRDLAEVARGTNSTVLVTSEARAVLGRRGIRSAMSGVNDYVTTQLKLTQVEVRLEYEKLHHKKVRVDVTRSKTIPPGGSSHLYLFGKTGFDPYFDMLKYMIRTGAATRKGTYWILDTGERLGPGYETAAKQLEEQCER